MTKIKEIFATLILDSRGTPTIEATVILNDGIVGVASCPSGASIGGYEAAELRDGGKAWNGMGVQKAIDNIQNIIGPKLIGLDVEKQQEIDKMMIELDGTQNKGKLGANGILSVSMAVAKAGAKSSVLPLFLYLRQFIKTKNTSLRVPTPLFNIINGGKHGGDNSDFQEFLVIPTSSNPFSDSLQNGVELYQALKETLKQNNLATQLGDEGGFSPKLSSNKEGLSLIKRAIETTSLRLGFNIFLGIDVASNNFYSNKNYHIKDKSMYLSSNDLIAFYQELSKEFPILYLEDPLSEDDWDGWSDIVSKISQDVLIVGDDLIATNPYRLQTAINKKAVTGVIIKPNQIGTVIEALAVVEVAKEAGLKIIVSHRSGETEDDFIADFAVAVSADYAKFGAPARGERVAKYNRLLKIERQLKSL